MALPKKVLSIDIGSERIKIAHTQRKGKHINLLEGFVLATPENSIRDGVLINKDEISSVIKKALTEHKIKEKNVIFSVASTKIISREVELPDLKGNKLKSIIRLNAEEYFPVNLTEYTLDYTISDHIETEGGKKAKVIVYAALTSLLEEYIQVADLLGLRVCGIDYAGNSVVNFVKNEAIDGVNLFLDFGAENTMVTIMDKNVVKFSRNLVFGTKPIHEVIKNHFEVSFEEAVKMASEKPLLNLDGGEVSYLVHDVTTEVDQILNGISRLVDYYASRNKKGIEKIYIMGGGCDIYNLKEYIEKFFGIKTEKLLSFTNVVDKSKTAKSVNYIHLAQAIGATLMEINLLPDSIKNRDAERSKKRIPYLMMILILVAIAALHYMKWSQVNKLEDDIVRVQDEIATLQEIDQIKADLANVTMKANFRSQIEGYSTTKSDSLLRWIDEFEANMPKEAFLLSIDSTETSLLLDVVAKNEETVGQLLTYLKGIVLETTENGDVTLFSDVYLPAITRNGAENDSNSNVTVSITCTYRVVEQTTPIGTGVSQ